MFRNWMRLSPLRKLSITRAVWAAEARAVCAVCRVTGKSFFSSCVTDVSASCAPPIEPASDVIELDKTVMVLVASCKA